MGNSFWEFKACSKLDILDEERHAKHINEALNDPRTKVMKDNGSFILYDEEKALLFAPETNTTRITLEVLCILSCAMGQLYNPQK